MENMTKIEFATLIGKPRQYVHYHVKIGNIITDENGLIIPGESLKNIMSTNGKGYEDKNIELRVNIPIKIASKLDTYAYDNKISINSAIRGILSDSEICKI